MTTFFKPYEGKRPFLFISYAHKQSDAVVDTIRILHERGWRLWYDEGIPAGSDWPANIARHMSSCGRVIFFLSARAMESQNCFSEIRTAARLGKPLLIVRLEDAPVQGEWTELLRDRQELPLLPDAAARAEAIVRSGFLPRRFKGSWTERIPWRALPLTASLAFFLAASAALGALATGRWTPLPTPAPVLPSETPTPAPTAEPAVQDIGEAQRFFAVSFPDSLQERAIRRSLDIASGEIYRWQLADISELYICGNVVARDLSAVSFDADGVCRVNSAPVGAGTVSDLSLFAYMVRLESLALVDQPLGELSALSGHVLLRELSLAGSAVESLDALSDLPSLETLHLEHTAVRDLTPLEALGYLRTVTVSRDMLPLVWSEDAAFSVVLSDP